MIADFSSRNLKTIISKVQTEADAINFLLTNNEGFDMEEYRCEIQLHFMVIKECTKLLEKMFTIKGKKYKGVYQDE
tara:strand:- start:266 stop:493 length:228 start_codon:yes stop_codon:yes gene_type:complete